ncbi:MAG: EFR1 family ferrodoxin [Firmicutes bacterium]|nr:EFR1 family ferrodoxin [Bacillota bacterium]MCM1401777.1 EFR1 family ferrodoxin [Bacteroides sp.]MCM1477645.1 EFR1 family ferrodoxin [Bacteroides sp.]
MILCFSACGNTALVAKRLGELLNENVVSITNSTPLTVDAANQQRIIWAFPIYSWGLPTIVRNFIKNVVLANADNMSHFMVATCGDDAGLADQMWRKELRLRGWHPRSAHTVIMPNTYVALPGFDVDPPTLTKTKLHNASERIAKVAHAIKCNSGINSITRGKAAWIKTRLIYPLFMKFLCSPRPFRSSVQCNGCGTCSCACPMGNIDIVNGHPVWSNRCVMCLACYHRCPQKCISYGSRTTGKGHYVAPRQLPE